MNRIFRIMIVFIILFTCFYTNVYAYDDVPPTHWAYKAIKDATSLGLINGYSDNTFKGNKPLSRYEAAQIVSKLISSGYVSIDEQMMNKLTVEFSDELAMMGIKLNSALKEIKILRNENREIKKSINKNTFDKFDIGIECRGRFEENSYDTLVKRISNMSNTYFRSRLNIDGKVNDMVSLHMSYEDDTRFGTFKENNNMSGTRTDRNLYLGYIDFNKFGTLIDRLRFGRQTLKIGNGFIFNNEIDGFKISKNYKGFNCIFGAFDSSDYINLTGGLSGANDGLDEKIISVNRTWDRLNGELYHITQDRVETPGYGNINVTGISIDAKLGEGVRGYFETSSFSDDGYKKNLRGGAVNMAENGLGIKSGFKWKINDNYNFSAFFQNRKKDFFVMGENDDYSDSAYFGNYSLLPLKDGSGKSIRDNYNNSNILTLIFGTKILKNLDFKFWYEKFTGDEAREDLYGKGTKLTSNFDQSNVQSVITYRYKDDTSFKIRYRSVNFDDSDPDYQILSPNNRPTNYSQARMDINIKF